MSSSAVSPRYDSLATRSSMVARLRDTADHGTWDAFYRRYRRFLFNLARRRGLADADAEDAVQETIISVMKAMPDFRYERARSSFRNWLCVIAWRRMADYYRRRERRVQIADGAEAEDLADPSPPPDEAWDRHCEEEWLAQAIDRVRESASPEAFRLWHETAVKGVKPRETARTFGVSAARVYLAKHRIAALVKRELERAERELENFAAARAAGTLP